MSRLKFHPRDALPNATLLARGDALYLELTGAARAELGDALALFRGSLEMQDPTSIASHRERLTYTINKLRR